MPALFITQQPEKSQRNKLLIKKINEAFHNGNKEFISAHIDDEIRWNIVGMPLLTGIDDFLKVMEIIESSIGGFPYLDVKNIISEGDYVIVESTSDDKKSQGRSTNLSLCEVFRFKDEKIVELTTYAVYTEISLC